MLVPYSKSTLTDAPSGFNAPFTVAVEVVTPLVPPVTGVSGWYASAKRPSTLGLTVFVNRKNGVPNAPP